MEWAVVFEFQFTDISLRELQKCEYQHEKHEGDFHSFFKRGKQARKIDLGKLVMKTHLSANPSCLGRKAFLLVD